jgi:glyoxylase-like metal-dependent hydrolase (beta-lactamase superfamily II)
MSTVGSDAARTWRVGDVLVTRIEEGSFRVPIEHFIPDAGPDVRARHAPALSAEQLDADGTMTLVMGAFVVESRGRRILVDTCLGAENERGIKDSPFLARLTAAGFAPDTIDVVVCTHVHLDHVGWNTTVVHGERRPTFGRAEYLFCADELSALRDTDPEDYLYSSLATDVTWVVDAGLATLVPPTQRLTDEVSLLPTFGHSPGHVSVLITSAGRHAVITGDAVHHPIQLLAPGLGTAADADAGAAARSRLGLIDRVVDTRAAVFGTHFAGQCALNLRQGERGLGLDALQPLAAPWQRNEVRA